MSMRQALKSIGFSLWHFIFWIGNKLTALKNNLMAEYGETDITLLSDITLLEKWYGKFENRSIVVFICIVRGHLCLGFLVKFL